MTNAELVALLREAREALYDPDDAVTCVCTCCTLTKRIAAALAAQDAVPPGEEKVEWWSQSQQEATMGQSLLRIWCAGPHAWRWTAWSPEFVHKSGTATTEDEAKSAAIEAARRMR